MRSVEGISGLQAGEEVNFLQLRSVEQATARVQLRPAVRGEEIVDAAAEALVVVDAHGDVPLLAAGR
jgi:predicted lipoprotein